MSERWILNASPIIILARAGYGDLLTRLPDDVLVPEAVAEEIKAGPEDDLARRALAADKFQVIEVPVRPEILTWDLGKGETAVLSFALSNPGWTAILDDRAARACARSYSLSHKGTLAVVILAKKRGMISSAGAVLRAMQSAGFRLDDEIIRQALKQTTDEDW